MQHVAFEGPGVIAEVAAEQGIGLDVHRMDLDEPLPRVEELAGLVVLGGPMGALDDSAHPHLAQERALLRAAVARGLPVLGVCLGAQLLAVALGAPLHSGGAPEIGFGEVTLTAEGERDPVLGGLGPRLPVLHWHADTFDLPPGAARLASTAAYANQAFRVGSAYGLQFHVEVDGPWLDGVAEHLPPGTPLDRSDTAAVENVGRRALRRLLAEFVESPQAQ